MKTLIAICLKAGKTKVKMATAILVMLVALGDWSIGNTVSLAPVYILPMMLGAVVLRPIETAILAVVGSVLRVFFDTPASHTEVMSASSLPSWDTFPLRCLSPRWFATTSWRSST